MERCEYRKPDWLVQMEMIKERLAGGFEISIFQRKKILFLFSSYCSKRQDHEGDPDEPDQGGNKHRVQRRLLGKPSAGGVLVLQRQQAGRVGEGEDHDDPNELVPAHGGLHPGDGRRVRVQDREQAGQRQDEGEPDCQSNDRQM